MTPVGGTGRASAAPPAEPAGNLGVTSGEPVVTAGERGATSEERPAADDRPVPDDRVAALLPTLREAAEAAGAMLRRLGGAASEPRPDGGWTATRVVVHLAAVDDEVWAPRLRQLAAHGHPSWAWTEPDVSGVPEPSPDDAAGAFCAAREAVLSIVRAMDDEALRSTGLHAAFGELDVAGLLGEVARHDAEHLASLADAVAVHGPLAGATEPGATGRG